jgi:PhnB protein
MRRRSDTLILTGAETDVCVLSTALGAIDHGYRVIIVEDASPYMGTKAPPPGGLEGTPTFLFIYVEDVDAVVERAVKRAATLRRPAQDQFYGDRDAFIVDPFGHGWTVATHVEDVAPDEMMRRMAALQGEFGFIRREAR